jgi:hypothetical protein
MRRLGLFAIVLVAGCGGGGRDDGLSREEYVAQLDQICADFDERQKEIGEPESLEDVAEDGPEIQEEFEAAVQRVRDLGEPPEEIADDADRFLELAEEQLELIREIVEAARANDLQRAQEVAEEGESLDDESDRIATELGASSCAED